MQALVFDGFAIFDPRPIARRCEALYPGRGAELMTVWRTRQFEYTWLRTLGARYVDFLTVTDHALTFALAALELELGASDRSALLGEFMRLLHGVRAGRKQGAERRDGGFGCSKLRSEKPDLRISTKIRGSGR